MAKPTRKTGPRKSKKNVPSGVAHIRSTFNNTIVTITDQSGEAISWASAGSSGFKGAKKGTPLPPRPLRMVRPAALWIRECAKSKSWLAVTGAGRETAIRALQGAGLEITLIRDVTPIPHNGCRPPKRRRV